jgi:4-hydroxy-4-methyl-2-oxoglutarate aldolase
MKTSPASPNVVQPLTADEFDQLAALDSCSVANAIERFDRQLRNEGFTEGELTCHFPAMPSMLGYAFPLQVRSYAPPMKAYFEDTSWWGELLRIPTPRVLVIQDMDRHPGTGAFVGEVYAEILKALGCIGVITNGAVRDVDRVKPLNFHLYSRMLSVSRGYCHIVSSGHRVQIGGLDISSGDLLHGDCHGIIKIPGELARRIPATVAALRQKEEEIAAFCRSGKFDAEELRTLLDA